MFRKKYCPARIYKYGKVGLGIHDDRTKLEKLCDIVGDMLWQYDRKRAMKESYAFRSYFDWSMGMWITSPYARKEIEKKLGMESISVNDWHKEWEKKKVRLEEYKEKKLQKGITEVLKDVNQGRSFIKESIEKRREIYNKYGNKK
jgi:hypothetical protein